MLRSPYNKEIFVKDRVHFSRGFDSISSNTDLQYEFSNALDTSHDLGIYMDNTGTDVF